MLQLKSVEFVFENTDGFVISGDDVGTLYLRDIVTEFRKHDATHNALCKYSIANEFAIELKSTANLSYTPFDVERYRASKFERFTARNDLVCAIFKCYDDVSNEEHNYEYFFYWEDDSSEENNLAQKTYTSKTGNLYIVVHKDKGIEDFFTKIVIDNGE